MKKKSSSNKNSIWTKDIELIYQECLVRYRTEKIVIRTEELREMIIKAAEKAKENYSKLKEPKTTSVDLYTLVWVRQSITMDWAARGVKAVNLDSPPPSLKATAEFHLFYPEKVLHKLREQLFDVKNVERKKLWESFSLDFKEIEKRFKGMAKERNEFAINKGFSSKIDMSLNWFRIPKRDYTRFFERIDEIIDYCNQHLPKFDNLPVWFYSEFNIPCFMCRMFEFPLKTKDEALDQIAKRYHVLEKFRYKVNIKLGENSEMVYRKEADSFEIIIDRKGNVRHRFTDLIHELSHVIDYLQNFKRGINPLDRGTYLREKEAIKIESIILKKLSHPLYQALFAQDLILFHRVLFEIELYENPDQNLSRLYAKTFNRCFKGVKQKENPLYILDERIVINPFSTLPHAIAHSELILNTVDNK